MRPCWLAFTRRSRPLDGAPNPSCLSVSFPSSSAALGALVGACHQVVRGPPHSPPPRRCVVSSSPWKSCPPGLSPTHMSCSRARCSHRRVGLPPGAVSVPAYALGGTSRTRVALPLGLLRRRWSPLHLSSYEPCTCLYAVHILSFSACRTPRRSCGCMTPSLGGPPTLESLPLLSPPTPRVRPCLLHVRPPLPPHASLYLRSVVPSFPFFGRQAL